MEIVAIFALFIALVALVVALTHRRPRYLSARDYLNRFK